MPYLPEVGFSATSVVVSENLVLREYVRSAATRVLLEFLYEAIPLSISVAAFEGCRTLRRSKQCSSGRVRRLQRKTSR